MVPVILLEEAGWRIKGKFQFCLCNFSYKYEIKPKIKFLESTLYKSSNLLIIPSNLKVTISKHIFKVGETMKSLKNFSYHWCPIIQNSFLWNWKILFPFAKGHTQDSHTFFLLSEKFYAIDVKHTKKSKARGWWFMFILWEMWCTEIW